MKKLSLSIKVYILLILVLALAAFASVFFPSFPSIAAAQEIDIPKPLLALANAAIMLVLYGGLGLLGLKLAHKLGFADIFDSGISNRQRFITPGLVGCMIGVIFIVADIIFSNINDVGPLPHPAFPLSLLASLSAGIGEELIFRLFFISFWVWLISHVLFRRKWQNQIFWIVSVLSALAFAFGHIPSVMILLGFTKFSEMPPALLSEIIVLNSLISLPAAYYFRKYGFLAAVGIHFWTDIVWHVIWELF